jgi:hypothetical protein
MYAQYQYYQQPSTAVASQQQAMTWNGSAWVTTASAVQSSTYSTYEQPTKPAAIPPNPVATFTQYYHAWQANGKECEEYLRKIPFSNTTERTETQRRVDWAKYYADQSSRAAHHFYHNPNATSVPFELPPAPPESNKNKVAPPVPVQKQPAPAAVAKRSDERTPGSLTRYVKKCLDQCSTEDQRKSVQAEVEQVIAKAIQGGNLHSKNWDLESLIPVPGASVVPRISSLPQENHRSPKTVQSPGHYDGPSNRKPNHNKNKYAKIYGDELPENNSYYGRGSVPSPSTSKRVSVESQSSFGRRSSTQGETSYYGPASSSFQQHSSPPSSYHNPNTSSFGDSSSPHSSQKLVISPHEEFIPFQRKNKKFKKASGCAAATKGFEQSSHVLAKRANRFSGPGGILEASNTATTMDGHEKYMGKRMIGGSQKKLDQQDFEKMTVKGTCLTLEKEYLRLTAPPRAQLVRPKPILERHLANLKKEYVDRKHDYLWFCSQLKAVRQDCTVQRIQTTFAVDVYETHAKIALQEGDLNEYNQCQTQLKELYETGEAVENHAEFIAYRLLYYVLLSTNEKYDGGSSDMFKIMLYLTSQQRSHPAVAHALKVREALAFGSYLQFFRLHEKSPNLGRYLTALILPTMRMRALRRMAKAFRPWLDVEVCVRHLGFESTEEGKEWLISCGCVIEKSSVIMKDSAIHEPVVDKKNSLI